MKCDVVTLTCYFDVGNGQRFARISGRRGMLQNQGTLEQHLRELHVAMYHMTAMTKVHRQQNLKKRRPQRIFKNKITKTSRNPQTQTCLNVCFSRYGGIRPLQLTSACILVTRSKSRRNKIIQNDGCTCSSVPPSHNSVTRQRLPSSTYLRVWS